MDAAECNRNMVVDVCMLVWQANIYFQEQGLLLLLLLFVLQDGIFLTIAFINRTWSVYMHVTVDGSLDLQGRCQSLGRGQ